MKPPLFIVNVHFCLLNVTMVSVCVQLLMNTTSRWCSVRMTNACSTASGSPLSTECSPTVGREASPASQWLLVRLPAKRPPHGEDSPDLVLTVMCSLSSRVCVRSRCWDACMVVDGGTSFEFNDGAIATISMCKEDQLRTVVLDWPHEARARDTGLRQRPPQVLNFFIADSVGLMLFMKCVHFSNDFFFWFFFSSSHFPQVLTGCNPPG